MIDHENKFIFIHIRKTAGTSIERVFDENAGNTHNEVPYKHDNAKFMKRKFPSEWGEYFKFTFVRDPWDRFYSRYAWGMKKNMFLRHVKSFAEFAKKIEVGERVFKKRLFGAETLRSQFLMISDKDGKLLVDFIGRFENLQNDFNIVCDKIGIPRQQLPHKNKTKRKHYTEYYDEETKQIVAEKYAKDIEMFGYEFGE